MKKIYFLAATALALASCSQEDLDTANNTNGTTAITLSSGFNVQTRANKTGTEAATALGNNFVLFGNKTDGTNTQTVFDNYQANYVAASVNTTESNTAGWEYVGYQTKQTTPVDQSIKYWDFGATTYGFFGYSLGNGGGATVSVLDGESSTALNKGTYTIQGTAENLGKVYITDHFQKTPAAGDTQVDFTFKSIAAKARIGVYETIPGYSINSIKFYSADGTGDVANGTLYTAGSLADGGTYTVTFDDAGKALLAYANSGTGAATKTSVDFGAFTLGAAREYMETEGNIYLGRASNAATKTDYATVLPNPAGAAMTLKVDYTLVSRDGTGETISIKGATATVPAALTQWQSNYAYTYIFKISDNTNGQSGTVTGLYPITLDAIVADAVNGEQESVTTVAATSISTYEKGTNVSANDEYVAGTVYLVVGDGSAYTEANGTLYTAVATSSVQSISEAACENALMNGVYAAGTPNTWTVTDAKSGTLVLSSATAPTAFADGIPADATVDGVKKSVSGASFTAAAGTTYVYRYMTAAGSETAATEAYNAATPYYQKNAAGYYVKVTVPSDDQTNWDTKKSTYFTSFTQPTYAYKVIKVKAA